MKKLLIYLFVLTLASALTACNSLPTPQVKEPEKQEDTQKSKDQTNEETNIDKEEVVVEEEEVEDEKDTTNNTTDNQNKDNTTTENDDLALAFQAYIDEIMLLAPEEIRIIEAYGSVSGNNYVNDSIMYDELYYNVVPSYNEFVIALEGISSDNEIINDLHAIYVEAATIQLGAFTVMITALEEQSRDLVEMANQGLSEASSLITEWQAQVQILSVQTGVSF
ncbi:hypothetical protein [Ureibacillus acetophenoni]|uniref:Lipoprotein n=1 Tax=Ureibacillus acetophenoni TaxID=614649 RepID=A0A285UFD1_9BACL|nr:hypothetical protein [Ureibacillus acetophenoni]SOC39286.1 hypothetical protein SAMN05877842_105143 [Ureibacillus acetophenoni]